MIHPKPFTVSNVTMFWEDGKALGNYSGEVVYNDSGDIVPNGVGRFLYEKEEQESSSNNSGWGELVSYDGIWTNGIRDGYGQETFTSGCYRRGIFNDFTLNGSNCTILSPSGVVFQGVAIDDVPKSGKYTFLDGGFLVTEYDENGLYKGGYNTALPNGWETFYDWNTAGIYYRNINNGTFQWERPPVVVQNHSMTTSSSNAVTTRNLLVKTTVKLEEFLLHGISQEKYFEKLSSIGMIMMTIFVSLAMKLTSRSTSSLRSLLLGSPVSKLMVDFWYGATYVPMKCFQTIRNILMSSANAGSTTSTTVTNQLLPSLPIPTWCIICAFTVAIIAGITLTDDDDDDEVEAVSSSFDEDLTKGATAPAASSVVGEKNGILVPPSRFPLGVSFPPIVARTVWIFESWSKSLLEILFSITIKGPCIFIGEVIHRIWRITKQCKSVVNEPYLYIKAKRSILNWKLFLVSINVRNMTNTPRTYIGLLGPFKEEFQFRYFFDKVWHGLGRLLIRVIRNTGLEKSGLLMTVSPRSVGSCRRPLWVYVNSICFGLMHATNHFYYDEEQKKIVALTDDENPNGNDSILLACWQVFTATLVAMFLLNPLYLERGFAASFGAHASWNSLSILLAGMLEDRATGEQEEEDSAENSIDAIR